MSPSHPVTFYQLFHLFPSSLHLAFVVVLGHCPPHGYITSTYASRRVNETPSTLSMFFLLSCSEGSYTKKPFSSFFFFPLPSITSCKQNKQQVGRRGQPSWLHDVNLLICAMFEAVALVYYWYVFQFKNKNKSGKNLLNAQIFNSQTFKKKKEGRKERRCSAHLFASIVLWLWLFGRWRSHHDLLFMALRQRRRRRRLLFQHIQAPSMENGRWRQKARTIQRLKVRRTCTFIKLDAMLTHPLRTAACRPGCWGVEGDLM